MIGTSLSTVQSAIQALCNTDITLVGDSSVSVTGLITGVFDASAVPENQAFPYITVGMGAEKQDDTFDTRTYDVSVQLHIWTQAYGFATCFSILARLNQLLHRKSLGLLSGQTNVGMWYIREVHLPDPDGITQHMTAFYRAYSQELLS